MQLEASSMTVLIDEIRKLDGLEQVEYCPTYDSDGKKYYSIILRDNNDKRYGAGFYPEKEDVDDSSDEIIFSKSYSNYIIRDIKRVLEEINGQSK